ncbi:MAG: hypothetical protein ABGX22_11710, partial [Pirellulaceae bacterium]
ATVELGEGGKPDPKSDVGGFGFPKPILLRPQPPRQPVVAMMLTTASRVQAVCDIDVRMIYASYLCFWETLGLDLLLLPQLRSTQPVNSS